MNVQNSTLASYLEHTILKADTTRAAVLRVCQEAEAHHFSAVCIPPFFVPDATIALENSLVKIVTVAGFPLGYAPTSAKVEEIKRAINAGADEIDVVVNLAAVKSGSWAHVRSDIQGVTAAAHAQGKIIKIIIETALLSEAETQRLCDICNLFGVDFVKTATGFNETNNSPTLIQNLRSRLDLRIKIKAAGGIRSTEQAAALIAAGADKLGTSQSLKIIGL